MLPTHIHLPETRNMLLRKLPHHRLSRFPADPELARQPRAVVETLERHASTVRIVSACWSSDQSVYVSPVVLMFAWPASACAAFRFCVLSRTR